MLGVYMQCCKPYMQGPSSLPCVADVCSKSVECVPNRSVRAGDDCQQWQSGGFCSLEGHVVLG